MKIAVYNKSSHIRSYGGGEKVMAQMVKTLMDLHDVTLISEEKVDLTPFIKKFNTDITKVEYKVLPSELQISEYTKDFDIFINTSHSITNLYGQAKKNILYISFPKKILLKKLVLNNFLNKPLKKFFSLFIEKFLHFELQGKFRMLDLKGSVPFLRVFKYKIEGDTILTVQKKNKNKVYLVFDKNLDKEDLENNLEIFFNKTKLTYSDTNNNIEIDVQNLSEKIINLEIKIKDKKALKEQNLISITDSYHFKLNDSIWINFSKLFFRLLKFQDFLDTYDLFLSNSDFTKNWTKKYWNKETTILYPPSEIEALNPQNEKRDNKIITIGRFFEDEHNKKHIPMIIAFRKLIDENKLQNWELHMCGGSMKEEHNEKYLRKVKYLAQGYPIFIHEDISFQDLTKLLSESKLFWHAAGFGEDENLNPIKMEHFGIVPVEAMCSGVIPLLINKAGMKETVEHGKSGFLWNTLEELQEQTIQLTKDESLINEMRKNCIERAKKFNTEAFDRNLKKIIRNTDQ